MARAECSCCRSEYNVNADGTVRYHLAADPECHESADSRKCRGAGQPPAGAVCGAAYPGPEDVLCARAPHSEGDHRDGTTDADTHISWPYDAREPAEPTGYVCRIPPGPAGCGHPVQLTANGRARSHLDLQGKKCPGGSDWPLAVDERGNRTDTAPQAVGEALLIGDTEPAESDPLRDTHTGRTPEQRAGLKSPKVLERAIRRPGQPVLGVTDLSLLTQDAIEALNRRTPEQKRATAQRMDTVASEALGLPRDPELCAHEFTDTADVPDADGQDMIVSACVHCGLIEPDSPSELDYTEGTEPGPDPATVIKALPPDERAAAADALLGSMHTVRAGEPDMPMEPEWKTPAAGLAGMPEDVQALAALDPACWDCGHEVTPLVDRFGPDGSPEVIVWGCEADCTHRDPSDHYGSPCRPRPAYGARVGELSEGDLFVRHTARPPLNRLVFRADRTGADGVEAQVISKGPHSGRTGVLTDGNEEITCTDWNGNPRARTARPRARDTGGTSLNGPCSQGSGSRTSGPTPSPPARTSSPSPAPGSRPVTWASAPPVTSTTSSPETVSGPTAKASTSTRTAPMPDAFATPKQAAKESEKYDNYGRYKLLHPDTGKKVNWTRATTMAKSVQDTYALSMWSQRMVLKGAALRPDLTAAALTLDVKADKDRMNALVEDAKKAAGDKIAANKGTAVHAFTEDLDKEWAGVAVETRRVPDEYIPTVQAYDAVLRAFGLEPVPGLIEFTTAVRQYEVAGTSDRAYRVTRDLTFKLNGRTVSLYAGEYVIGDVKTGADLSYGWQEICIQLALYAQGLNTCGVWDWNTRRWARPEDPQGVQVKVRTDVGLVPHLPVDRSSTKAPLATLYAVDLDAGWAAVVLCGQVRSWRKERTLATPLEIADVADPQDGDAPFSRPVPAARPASLSDKAGAVTSRAEASEVFQEAVAARVSREELDRLVRQMKIKLDSHVEKGA